MKTIVRFYTAAAFQELLKGLVEEYVNLKAEHPKMFANISISVKRIVAAALLASHDVDSDTLCRLIDYQLMPGPFHEDKQPAANPFQSTLGASMRILDYAKQGSTRLNLDVLGPIEDHRLDIDPETAERYRITYRQYIHIALIYLNQLSAENKMVIMRASEEVYPFNTRGPGKRVKSQNIDWVDKSLAKYIIASAAANDV